jgi:hypothetical protein
VNGNFDEGHLRMLGGKCYVAENSMSCIYNFGKESNTYPGERTLRRLFIDNEKAFDDKPVENRLYPGILLRYRSILN